MHYFKISVKFILIIFFLILGCSNNADDKPKISNDILTIEYDNQMYSKITVNLPDTKSLMNDFSPSEQLILADTTIRDFVLSDVQHIEENNSFGIILSGNYSGEKIKIKKSIKTLIQKQFPDFLVTTVTYTNTGSDTINVIGWINNLYNVIKRKTT